MSKAELAIANDKCSTGELYFHVGIPVDIKLKAAYTTDNHLHIFPVVDDILMLKKDTAISPKNRTKNPYLRVPERLVEDFYAQYPSLRKGKSTDAQMKEVHSQPLSNEQLLELKTLLPKSGECFMSAVTHDVDALHNLVFNTDFNHYLHIDFSFARLNAIRKDLKEGTLLVLCDIANLPFNESSIDALFSFDYINEYDKTDQATAYHELKRILKPGGCSVVLYDKDKPLHAQSHHKSDQRAKKAMGVLAPWKKKKVPTIHFHPVELNSHKDDSGQFYTKASLGRQFS